jgi:hypothetical protein
MEAGEVLLAYHFVSPQPRWIAEPEMKRCPGSSTHPPGAFLPAVRFSRNRTRYDGLTAHCKDCRKARDRRTYEKDPAAHTARVRAWKQRAMTVTRQQLLAYLLDHRCAHCGERDPVVLEFHHRQTGKLAAIAVLLKDVAPWPRIAAEIEKCTVLCANCHRRQTAQDRGWWRAVRRSE